MKRIIYTILLSAFINSVSFAQVPIPVVNQQSPIMLIGGTAHLGTGDIIENAAIGFEQGKITFVGGVNEADLTGYETIDVSGKHIYPGLILPNSQVGLTEVGAVRAMSDLRETGSFNPNIRSLISYNTDSEYIATMRFNGVLLAESTPTGGRISGTSSIMEMEGWNWEDAAHTIDMGMHLNWPSIMSRRFDFATFSVIREPNKNYDEELSELENHFKDATAYGKENNKVVNLKMEAMQGLFDGSQTLFLHADGAKEIVESVKFAQQNGVHKIVVISGSATLLVADFLKDNNIGVIIPPTHRLPETAEDDVYGPYKLPKQLFDAGLTVSIGYDGVMGSRNLPFVAGTAVAYGLDREEALKMISSNTAELLGIGHRVGTLETGKDATLFVSEGDALDIRTNNLSHAFIRGKLVTLDNKQQELYKRFSKKYGHMD
jgi:imidazolonepropionase-like amidohydrolase